jgi:hypothetical protein
MDSIKNAIEFWNLIYQAKEINIKFDKKDGTVRYMRATLDFMKIPKEHRPKQQVNLPKIINLARKNKVVHVFDLEKQGWRAVNLDSVEIVDIDNKKYKVDI